MNPPMHLRNLLSTRRLTLAYGKAAIPGIIGVNAGASVAAVTLIVLFPNVPPFPLPLSAFGGALAVTLAIYLLAWNKGSSPMSLILVGVGIAAVLGAVTTLLVTFGEINTLSQASVWLAEVSTNAAGNTSGQCSLG
jgi:iron complex transport system permease protein